MRINSALSWSNTLHHAPMLALSAQTTAGFSSLPCQGLSAGSKLVLIFAMAVGGGLGSTAGGFKLFRLLIVASIFRLILLRTSLPKHSVIIARLKGHKIDHADIDAAQLLIILFIIVIALSWLPFVVMGHDPLDALFEVVSATGTAGLSVGITNRTLPTFLKGVLCFDMFMGRLEIFAWIVMFYPGTWLGRRMEER